MKSARYYPSMKRLTYYIGDKIQVTRTELTERQARLLVYEVADGPREIAQKLEIVPITKI